MDIITLQEYKDFYGLKKSDEDLKITLLIGSVSALIKTYLGFQTETGKIIEEHVSLDYSTDSIFLENYPIAEIIEINETGRYTTDSTVHVPLYYSSDYLVNKEEGILTRVRTAGGFANWPVSPGIVSVTYTTAAKFSDIMGETYPDDLKLATIEMVNYYKNEEWKSKTIQGTTTNAVNPTKDTDFPRHIQLILDRYL